MANSGQMKCILVRINSDNSLQILQTYSQTQSLFRVPSEKGPIPFFFFFDMSNTVIQTTPPHLSTTFPTTDSDSSSPAGIPTVMPLPQQHKGIHEDLVQVETTIRKQRRLPSRKNTKHSLINVNFRFIWYLDNKINPCIHPGNVMPRSSFSTKMSLCCQTSSNSEHWDY